ncbi:ABC transporter permease [Polaromonas sp.]|uniref:ABC transporter permease n=1 Tax=Polaromonas sp. TaxID=1869339 RepID=UPI003263C536
MSAAATAQAPFMGWQAWARPGITAAAAVIILATLWLSAPTFFRPNNLLNILVQASTLAVLASGMAVVMIGGGIDLSIPFSAALSAVLGAMYMRATGDAMGGLLIMLFSGLAIGVCNGVAVGYLRMIPFVVTLAMMTITNGAAVWLTNSISIADIPPAFVDPFTGRYLGLLPLPVLISVAVVAVASVFMSRTVYGLWLYAVGTNVKASEVARVPFPRVVMASYMAAGLAAGIGAVMLTGRLASASSNLASASMVLDVISACVIGGISIQGGVGQIWKAALGAVFITLLNNALNAAEVSLYVNQMIRGGVIIAFVALDRVAPKA